MEWISLAEKKRLEFQGIIKATEEAEVQRAEKILQRKEQEVTKLKKRENELGQLSELDDEFLFLMVTPLMIF